MEDAKHKMLMGNLLSICPHDIAEHILLRNPKTILETANIIQDIGHSTNMEEVSFNSLPPSFSGTDFKWSQ